MKQFKKPYTLLPKSIQKIIAYGVNILEPKSVILFGSRARGDFRDTSDFDICFAHIDAPKEWARFHVDVHEENFSLYATDLVLFENMNSEYQKNITKEGITLYE